MSGGGLGVTVDIEIKGPFLDGDPGDVLARAVALGVADAGEMAVGELQEELDNVLVNPTGFYRSRINFAMRQDGAARVSDGGVVYGPWLAGTSSRNERSRFKGYAHWRRAMQRTEEKATDIVERRVAAAVQELS